jgi:hypothetical protein
MRYILFICAIFIGCYNPAPPSPPEPVITNPSANPNPIVNPNPNYEKVDSGLFLVYQACNQWCWAAAIQMVNEKYGMRSSHECEIVSNRYGLNCCQSNACYSICNQGATADVVSAALNYYYIRSQFNYGPLSEPQLIEVLKTGSPVLAGTLPHAFVVSGYINNNGYYTYHILDPWINDGEKWITYNNLYYYNGSQWTYSWFNFR